MCGKMTCKVKSLLSQDHFLGEVLSYLVERNIYIYTYVYIYTHTLIHVYTGFTARDLMWGRGGLR